MHGSTSGGTPDEDDYKEEDDNKVEDNDKDDNKDNGISALGLDIDLWFSRGHQTRPNHTNRLKQTKPFAQTRADSRNLAQSRTDSHNLAQICSISRKLAQTSADSYNLAQIRTNLCRIVQNK